MAINREQVLTALDRMGRVWVEKESPRPWVFLSRRPHEEADQIKIEEAVRAMATALKLEAWSFHFEASKSLGPSLTISFGLPVTDGSAHVFPDLLQILDLPQEKRLLWERLKALRAAAL